MTDNLLNIPVCSDICMWPLLGLWKPQLSLGYIPFPVAQHLKGLPTNLRSPLGFPLDGIMLSWDVPASLLLI